jgi:hypothetical protein
MQRGEWEACDRQLSDALARLRRSRDGHPCRELALAITHLQEAQHWLRDNELMASLEG